MDSLFKGSYSRTQPVTPPRRNPITQSEIVTPPTKRSKKSPPRFEGSPIKPEGIGRAKYSEKGWRSFSLYNETPEPYRPQQRIISPAPSEPVHGKTLKRASEYTPTRRDPINQEEVQISPVKIRTKVTEGSIDLSFNKQKGKTETKNREGLYFESMKGRIFNGPEVEIKRCLKTAPTKISEVAGIITYQDCALKEEKQSRNPNNNKIKKKDLAQKGTLTGLAKIYNEKNAKSQVVFN